MPSPHIFHLLIFSNHDLLYPVRITTQTLFPMTFFPCQNLLILFACLFSLTRRAFYRPLFYSNIANRILQRFPVISGMKIILLTLLVRRDILPAQPREKILTALADVRICHTKSPENQDPRCFSDHWSNPADALSVPVSSPVIRTVFRCSWSPRTKYSRNTRNPSCVTWRARFPGEIGIRRVSNLYVS